MHVGVLQAKLLCDPLMVRETSESWIHLPKNFSPAYHSHPQARHPGSRAALAPWGYLSLDTARRAVPVLPLGKWVVP